MGNICSRSMVRTDKDIISDTFYNKLEQNIEMNLMDIIIFNREPEFRKDFMPIRWIFTDLMGNFHYKDINNVTLTDIIKAFFTNLNLGKNKNEYCNEDLMNFIATNQHDKIAIAIVK
jgi:hypothetical protein